MWLPGASACERSHVYGRLELMREVLACSAAARRASSGQGWAGEAAQPERRIMSVLKSRHVCHAISSRLAPAPSTAQASNNAAQASTDRTSRQGNRPSPFTETTDFIIVKYGQRPALCCDEL